MTYAQDYYTYLMPDAFKLWNEIEAEAKTKVGSRLPLFFVNSS
jgi:hypothetical protein